MKTMILILGLLGCAAMTTTTNAQYPRAGKTALVHVVAFKYKPTATPDQIKALEAKFASLKTSIREIQSYAGGASVGKPERAKGFHFCAVLKYKSQKDLDAYVVHADHEALVTMIKEHVEDVFVFDFWE